MFILKYVYHMETEHCITTLVLLHICTSFLGYPYTIHFLVKTTVIYSITVVKTHDVQKSKIINIVHRNEKKIFLKFTVAIGMYITCILHWLIKYSNKSQNKYMDYVHIKIYYINEHE